MDPHAQVAVAFAICVALAELLRVWLMEFLGTAWRGDMADLKVFRNAQAKAHPDRPTGSNELFKQVTEAGQMLGVV